MHSTRKSAVTAAALLAVATSSVVGCEGVSHSEASTVRASKPGCPAVLASAKHAVKKAEDVNAPWGGPATGPRAVPGKSIVYVAQTMANPGVAGAAAGAQEAGKAIGWDVRAIDGRGSAAGIQAAFSKAIAEKPSGIVIGGFDPASTPRQVQRANAAGIPLIGWHAVAAPGPSRNPKLFSNITTNVEAVAKISADWIIARSNGHAGVVVFTDASIPFAKHKSELIKKELATCSGVKLLSYENVPIPQASSLMLGKVSSLLHRFGDRWTYSVAINDLYFEAGAPALRGAGKQGDAAPFNMGAGDGDPSAFQRINGRDFQAATVPEPLSEQGWQVIDEFNRAFAGEPASGYVAPVHVTTAANSGGAVSWDSQGYRDAYRRIWDR